jgi:hypothetical protein
VLGGDLLLVHALQRTQQHAPEIMPDLIGTLRGWSMVRSCSCVGAASWMCRRRPTSAFCGQDRLPVCVVHAYRCASGRRERRRSRAPSRLR